MNEIDPIEYGRLIQSVERLTRDVQVLRLVTFGRSLPGETISAAAWSLEGEGK